MGLAVVAAVAIVLVVAPWDEPVSRRLALRPCSVGGRAAECGRLAVAEDPGDPAGRKIGLDVVVFRATGDHPKPDPLVWFAG